MNAIDVGRSELACLGLHPGARHPNVADSTPVQDEDSTIFYDYWTFNRPTVIKTGKTGRPLEATIYTSTTDGEEQAIPTSVRQRVRSIFAWLLPGKARTQIAFARTLHTRTSWRASPS